MIIGSMECTTSLNLVSQQKKWHCWDSNPFKCPSFTLEVTTHAIKDMTIGRFVFGSTKNLAFGVHLFIIDLILELSTNAALVMKIYKVSFLTQEVIGFIFSKGRMASNILKKKKIKLTYWVELTLQTLMHKDQINLQDMIVWYGSTSTSTKISTIYYYHLWCL